jgi:vancomycin resistance protein YoaR
VRADPSRSPRRAGRRPDRPALTTAAIVGCLLAALAVLVGLAFAGSRQELAEGTRVAGVDVGGRSQREATRLLQRRFERVADVPVTFAAGGATYSFTANQLGVEPNWRKAVAAAADESGGFGPVRGFKRLHTRVFGADVFPQVAVVGQALDFALDEIAKDVDVTPRDAALVRRGLRIEVARERSGVQLDRETAAHAVVRALASLDRSPRLRVAVPTVLEAPRVTASGLAPATQRARVALSAPVTLRGAGRSWRIPRWRIAKLLQLPKGGATGLAIAGPGADAYFEALARRVDRPAADASFDVSTSPIQVVPARDGLELDEAATARRLLRATTSPTRRVARVVVARSKASLSTDEARGMGITGRLSTYLTYYAGSADRITNLRLGVQALDGTLVAPGDTFSLNDAIGERTVERGFRPAPVIIGTKYSTEVGGGTSQVATTVFNAAWEAGVRITERNPHALYISRYPLGRDATVYWPSLDLKFENDTGHWILVKGFAEGDGIRVSLYGGEKRRVESSAGTRTITGKLPVKRIKDRKLLAGTRVVEEEGEPPSATSVTRTIYREDGSLLRAETWNTTYRAEPRVVRVGTKPKARPKPPPKDDKPSATTTTDETTTTTTEPTQPRAR